MPRFGLRLALQRPETGERSLGAAPVDLRPLPLELGEWLLGRLGVEPAELSSLLNDGELVLERTLSLADARARHAELTRLSVSAEWRDLDHGGARVDMAAPPAAAPRATAHASAWGDVLHNRDAAPTPFGNEPLELEAVPRARLGTIAAAPPPTSPPRSSSALCGRCGAARIAGQPCAGCATTAAPTKDGGRSLLRRSPPLRLGLGLVVALAVGYAVSSPYSRRLERSVAVVRAEADRDRYRPDPTVHAEVLRLDSEADDRADGSFLRVVALWLAASAVVFAAWLLATR